MVNVDVRELAIAAWRLEKWLENLNAERKMAAKSALRNIKKYISSCNIEIKDPLGSKFDPGLAVEVVNNENPEVPEEDLIIIETLSPYIFQDGELIQYAKVIIGTTIREAKTNNEIKEEISSDNHANEEIPETKNNNYLCIKEEIEKLKSILEDKPKKKTKIAISIFSGIVIVLLLTNILMLSLYKHEFSSNADNNSLYSNSEELNSIKQSINELKDGNTSTNDELSEIRAAVKVNCEKLDEIIKTYNNSLENEVKLQMYTVQNGDSLYSICQAKGIDFNQNIKLIKGINGLENPSKIHIGQTIVLPVVDTEE